MQCVMYRAVLAITVAVLVSAADTTADDNKKQISDLKAIFEKLNNDTQATFTDIEASISKLDKSQNLTNKGFADTNDKLSADVTKAMDAMSEIKLNETILRDLYNGLASISLILDEHDNRLEEKVNKNALTMTDTLRTRPITAMRYKQLNESNAKITTGMIDLKKQIREYRKMDTLRDSLNGNTQIVLTKLNDEITKLDGEIQQSHIKRITKYNEMRTSMQALHAKYSIRCPKDWTKIDGYCYIVKSCTDCSGDDAVKLCVQLGGSLARIRSQAVHNFVSIRSPKAMVWIGGRVHAKQGEWMWQDGTKLIDGYQNVVKGFPLVTGHKCMYMWSGVWFDGRCKTKWDMNYACDKATSMTV